MTIAVVLHRTQNIINLAGVVRAMKNFGFRDLRLVAPCEYDAYRIEGIAHHTGDLLKRIEQFDTLDAALADRTLVVGLTARQRTAKQNILTPREAAAEILAAGGHVAVVLGPEDAGLSNEELDRCHRVVTIPTNPRYASLNLVQAFTVMAYELFLAGEAPAFKPPRRRAPPAPQEDLERLFGDVEAALDAIDFFKTRQRETIMRTVRGVIHRTPLDLREAKLLRAMSIEVVRYLERWGAAR